ncbi:MAG: hypothetical protein JW973_16770 [Bacteroidales bacterium]|nr:hypothetical protein [Bacteroidales bacterium]
MKNPFFYRMRLQAVLVSLLLACFCLMGQESYPGDYISDPAYIKPVLTEEQDPNVLKVPKIKKVDFSFATGMIVGTIGHDNYFGTAYIAPAISYNISPRMRIRAGSLIFLSSYYKPSHASIQSGEFSAGSPNLGALFIAADYFVTNRMILTGTYFKMPENNLFQRKIAPEVYNRYKPYYNVPSESMSIGLNYKVTKGFSIGAEFRISNNYQPLLSPYPYESGYPQYYPSYW